jgi:hypothetical protein
MADEKEKLEKGQWIDPAREVFETPEHLADLDQRIKEAKAKQTSVNTATSRWASVGDGFRRTARNRMVVVLFRAARRIVAMRGTQ